MRDRRQCAGSAGFRPATFTNQVRSSDHFHLELKLISHSEELLFNRIKMYHFQDNNRGIRFCTIPNSYCNTIWLLQRNVTVLYVAKVLVEYFRA